MSAVPVSPRLTFIILLCLAGGFNGAMGQGPTNAPKPNPAVVPPPTTTWIAPTGETIASQLQNSVSIMDRSKKFDQIEPMVERTVSLHSNEWRVLFQGARIYAQLERSGFWINGRFRRGDMVNPPKGARRVHAHKRDHVRALQLLDRAIRLASIDSSIVDKADFYWEAAQILVGDKGYVRMYELTDLTKLPTLDFHEPKVLDRESIPLGADGYPQFFAVPQSWDTARNDGERLRWLLSRARALSGDYEAEAEFIEVTQLMKAYYGVQTLTENPGYNPQTRKFDDGREETALLLASVDRLKKNESMAIVGGRVRKFALPEDQNFVTRLESITRLPQYREYATLALEELAEIFENRRQYERAAQYWQRLVQLSGGRTIKDAGSENGKGSAIPSWEAERLDQIAKSWGRFEDVQPVQVGEPLELAYWYRNGREVTFTAHRVDVTALVADLLAYLRSDPFPIDPNRISVSKLGLNIVRDGGERYLKDKVSEWSQALEPSSKHWDQRIEVPVPMDQPGAYLVEAKIDGGHRSSVLVWINDMSILRRPLEDGLFYYVADKKNGTPVGWAKFTFVGYRLSLVNQQKETELDVHGEEIPEALRRQYHVLTKEITKWADAKGQLTVEDSVLEPDYRWFLLTTAPGERVAVLGFSDLKPTGSAPVVEGSRLRQFVATDKETYLPGQPCHFKGWIRQRQSEGLPPAYTSPVALPVSVALMNAKNEVIADLAMNTDGQASFDGSFVLPADLNPGVYRVVSQSQGSQHEVALQVAPSAQPPASLSIESETAQLIRGETWNVSVKAEAADGTWLSSVPLRYRVVRRPHTPIWKRDQPHAWLFGDRYDFGTPPYRWFLGWKYWGWDWAVTDGVEDIVVTEGRTLTSRDGVALISVPTEPMREEFLVEEDFEIEVSLADEPAIAPVNASVVVSERSYRVFTKVDQPYYHVNDEVKVNSWARKYDGTPVTGKGQLILYRVKWGAKGEPLERGWKKWLNPDKNGNFQSSFKVTEAGQYRVTFIITDAAGDRFEGSNVFIVADDKFTGADCRFNPFEILSDRVVYAPGDRARLRFNTENVGQSVAVFVRPRDGVFGKAEVLRLDQKSTPYEIIVKDDDYPSFVVEAIILNNGEFEVHTKEVYVRPPTPLLTASLKGDRSEYRPGDEATFTVTLADDTGAPVAGVVQFKLAPEEVASGEGVDQLAKAFWDDRRKYQPSAEHGLRTKFQSFSSPPELSMQPIGIFGSVRVGESAVVEEVLVEEESSQEDIVIPFAPLATSLPSIWEASVVVGPEGSAEITATLPDADGEWVASVSAVTSGAEVASAQMNLVVKRAWSVVFEAPESVVEGDRFVVSASAKNRLVDPVSAPVALGVTLPLEIAAGSDNDSEVTIGPDEVHKARWEIVAKQGGQQNASLSLRLGKEDAVEHRKHALKILKRVEKSERWWNFSLASEDANSSKELSFSLPPDLLGEASALTVQGGHELFEQLLPAFDAAARERALGHTFAEDLLAEAVPLIRFGGYVRQLDEEARAALLVSPAAWMLEDGALESFGKRVSEVVWAQQGSDGGWGRGDGSEPLATAAVLEGLGETKESTLIALPPDQMKSAVERLKEFQTAAAKLLTESKAKKSADTLDAYVYLTLLRHGSDSSRMRNYLFRDWRKLTPLGQTMLVLALHHRGDNADRNTIRFSLGEELVKNEDTGAIQLKPKNTNYWWKWYGSATEVQARYTDFLVRVKGEAPVTKAAALQLLLSRKRSGFWTSTRDSSLGLGALLDYLELTKGKPTQSTEGKLTLWQGEQPIAESKGGRLTVSGTALAQYLPTTPLTGEPVEAAPLRLSYEGKGTFIAQAYGEFQRQPALMAAEGTDLKLSRQYVRSGTETVVQAGELVAREEALDVILTLSSARSLEYLTLTDFLPAGFVLAGELPEAWTREGNRVLANLAALDGDQSFTYRIRAVAEGKFHALPTEVQCAHLERLRASSDEIVFLVR